MSNLIPNGWEIKSIDEVATVFAGGTPSRSKPEYYVGNIPWVKSGEVNARLIYRTEETISEIAVKESSAKWAKSGSVLVAMYGATAGKVAKLMIDATLNQAVSAINGKHGATDNDFLLYAIESNSRELLNTVQGSGQPNLSGQLIKSLSFPVPPLLEQQKIATILSSVDDVIEKTRAQIDKLKDLKTGMMQELLTKGIGHTEFKDSPVGRIPASWSVVPLDSVVSTMESGWSPQCESNPARSGEWAILKTTAVTWSGFDFRANKKLPEQLEPRPAIQVEPHDILITRAGPSERVGVVSYVAYVPSRIMLSDKLIRIKANQDQNPQFLSFWLSTEFVRNFFAQRTTGLAQSQTNISQEILKSVPCAIPPLAEQNVISNAIAALERELNLKREILQHKKSLKKSLMQDLLTGKVRVKLTDKESAVV